jgi:hypothetical protein
MQQVAPLFDDFVGSREQCSRHLEAERVFPVQDAIDVLGGAAPLIRPRVGRSTAQWIQPSSSLGAAKGSPRG